MALRISDLGTAPTVEETDLVEIAEADVESPSGYSSYKTTILGIANKVATGTQYTGLNTIAKNLVGAINEAAEGSTVEVTPILTEGTKIATITVDDTPADLYGENTKEEIRKMKTPKTVTGNPVTFETIEKNCIKEATATFTPKQDLHGYDHPWSGGNGKNKLNAEIKSATTVTGITGQCYADNRFTISGTSTGLGDFVTNCSPISILSGETISITLFGSLSFDAGSLFIYVGGKNTNFTAVNQQRTLTFDADTTIDNVRFRCFNGTIINGDFKVMIEKGSTGSTSYAPYSNICPISGWDGLELTVSDGQTDTDYTATFPDTIYGGSYDFVSGEGVIDTGYVDLGTLEWTLYAQNGYFNATIPNMYVPQSASERNKGIICSQYKPAVGTKSNQMTDGEMLRAIGKIYIKDSNYATEADFKTAMSGVQLCYELATPTQIELTGQAIEALKGVNVVSTDADTAAITYTEMTTLDDMRILINAQMNL